MKKEPKKCNYRNCDQLIINKNGNRDYCNDDCYYAAKLLRQNNNRKKIKIRAIREELSKLIKRKS